MNLTIVSTCNSLDSGDRMSTAVRRVVSTIWRTVTNRGALFCAGLCLAVTAQGENWPGWRGPERSGVSPEAEFPLQWSESQGILWQAPLPGQGISNPIVWDNQVLLSSSDGPQQEQLHLVCLDRDSGSQRWHAQLWGTAPTLYHATKSSMASPSPITDGECVYAFYGTGDVFCLDLDGQLRWQRSLAEEYGPFENRFAASSSPLLYEDLLILQCDHYGASYILAIEKTTGKTRWKTDRPGYWLSWSSPQLVESGDDQPPELVVCGSEKCDGLDPRNGTLLWSVGGLNRECVPTPLFAHGLIYVTSGYNGISLAIHPGGRGDVSDTHVAWSNTTGTPFVPSAIIVDDCYYLLNDRGFLTCLDALTGEERWRKRLGGNFTASPVAAGGKIYLCSEEGETIVLQANREGYEELARNALPCAIYASPALSQGRIFLRATDRVFCLGGVQ